MRIYVQALTRSRQDKGGQLWYHHSTRHAHLLLRINPTFLQEGDILPRVYIVPFAIFYFDLDGTKIQNYES